MTELNHLQATGTIQETSKGNHTGFLLNTRFDAVRFNSETQTFTVELMGDSHKLAIEPENIKIPGYVYTWKFEFPTKTQTITIETR